MLEGYDCISKAALILGFQSGFRIHSSIDTDPQKGFMKTTNLIMIMYLLSRQIFTKMGCSASCQTFESLSQAVQWICVHKANISHISHIIDDYLFREGLFTVSVLFGQIPCNLPYD